MTQPVAPLIKPSPLSSTEHADPAYPYTTLPNLTHLDLFASGITCEGLIELAKSQLFSQLEDLDVGACNAQRWGFDEGQDDDDDDDDDDEDGQQLPPGLLALFTHVRVSNLKTLMLYDLIPKYAGIKLLSRYYDGDIAQYFQYIGNCKVMSE